ncbi:right-handed parallel beta-helix repeat-containing protein [Autumnicola psychrophila]|uniref:Right handed beta helix domain-containing protein n=1 Tax=Autumnicola psychrophila TaxID=3075592 RepID=A0ABU3DLY7_9FLAO|nr:right-handed parallel beta-helix repeat-containing protein [Zunongwangia sp. F225]MDT0684736.1 hypothetical protein [Zunongwangia sp. F225]
MKDSNKPWSIFQFLIVFLFFPFLLEAQEIEISSLQELTHYAGKSGNTVRMEPGLYKLGDYLTTDSIQKRKKAGNFQFLTFSGDNNVFDLSGVTIEIDTEIRTMYNAPIHNSEFLVLGNSNFIEGLNLVYKGEGTSPGGSAFTIAGEGNTLKEAMLVVKGSFPYGYGDLFGKGGPDVISHQKHSGILITGSNTKLFDCKLYMRSFGHGYYIQKDAKNIHFENCYVEGVMRATDDILEETSGPAYDVKFRTWTPNREGEYVVTPGYMKSLSEDGFRTYGGIKNVTFKNCTVKNMRGGFELRTDNGVYLENCTTIGTERAYWVGDDAVIKNCKGDAKYGPLLFLEGSNVSVDLTVMPSESDKKVHALATIQGKNNKVRLRKKDDEKYEKLLPILIGYKHPEHGEAMSPYGEALTENLELINATSMPVIIGAQTKETSIHSIGKVEGNMGKNKILNFN